MRTNRQSGVTLIELLVGLSIAALLVTLALPGYSAWLADAQVRNAAESLGSGLRFAKAQAILRNEPVRLVLNPATCAGGWSVQVDATGTPLQAGNFSESSCRAQFTVTPAGTTRVTYSALGMVMAPNPSNGSAPMTLVRVTIPSARELDVYFGGVAGSGVKICDPDPSLIGKTPPDSRVCPT